MQKGAALAQDPHGMAATMPPTKDPCKGKRQIMMCCIRIVLVYSMNVKQESQVSLTYCTLVYLCSDSLNGPPKRSWTVQGPNRQVQAHSFYTSARAFWELPEDLAKDYHDAVPWIRAVGSAGLGLGEVSRGGERHEGFWRLWGEGWLVFVDLV